MASKFYDPGEKRSAKVSALFARVASRYDLINDLQSFGLHRHWKRQLVRRAAVQAGETALDLCSGSGDIAFGLARAGATVTGLDFSPPMLAVAQARRQMSERRKQKSVPGVPPPTTPSGEALHFQPRVRFVCGDALAIPFANDSFDLVTISYGLRNLASLEMGLREMWRVARPGARLLVLDFGKPDSAPLRSIYFSYLKWVVPLFGKMFCGDADTHAYILESLQHYPAQRGVAGRMREIGCVEVKIVNLLGGIMSLNYAEKSREPRP